MLNKNSHENFFCLSHLLAKINIKGRKNGGLSKRSGIKNIYTSPPTNAATTEILKCFFKRINVNQPDNTADKNNFIFHAVLTLKKISKKFDKLKLLTDSKW
jgi:hypothetical protein